MDELLKDKKKLIQFEHECKMKELEREFEIWKYKHDKEMEAGRIKTAEIRRKQERDMQLEIERQRGKRGNYG